MANGQEASGTKKSSKKSKKASKKQKASKNATIQRMDKDQIERMPSNAPTMAIAPSDYEHIFHEGQNNVVGERVPPSPPAPPPATTLPPLQTLGPIATRTAPPQPYPLPSPAPYSPSRPRSPEQEYQQQFDKHPYGVEVPVTPDGYTMLGHPPLATSSYQRRIALPPHIVRASNQFSRAALARVARYLASRADVSTMR